VSLDAQGQVLTLNNVQLSDSATYSVIVFNSAGSIESTPARLTVLAPVSISGHPQPLKLRGSTNTADYGFTTNNATFSVAAVGTGTLRYQWRYNGANIAGANGQNYTVNSVGLAQEGLYDVVVDDDISTTTSTAARLTVLVTPVYLLTPLNQVIVSNGTFTVSGAFHGNPAPFRVEWREISTVRSSNLTAETITIFTSGPITNKLPNLTNTWRLVVFNDAAPNGVPVSFSVVALADADGDRIPDEWEAANGFDPNNPANALLDSDGDGMNNLSEYLAGTDPNNPLSFLKIEQTVTPGQATVRFGAVANHTYTIRYTDALGGPWHKLADVLATSNNRVETIPDPTWTSSRFYQVITPSQPQP